ncbi:Aldehyde oxidase and xanthine dehydrogenase, a/b hammerhead [Pedobacter sp. BAL39]|uniref:xanthine dehydrogenase family protein molybdopterin-binding subunit n=1 Tax=Pedobacter sp. BAL39 TaxID=391596 RepID=UPI00015599AB|nr:xanthine dehydrogenase family protein molybdopterin-binding subunit [Pedobacter sp. BAL39]EDM37739.1 Aldehyde oxidase and xanthine dehydrogenase, a/b hammerhead [Pedobacter sp. BAL39]
MNFFKTKTSSPKVEGRVEGVFKVTGTGKYSAEYHLDGMTYAVIVGSTVPAGRIESIQLDQAKQVEGVLDILTHQNRPQIPAFATKEKLDKSGYSLPVLHTDQIYFKGQPIALVVATTLEDAMYAASLVTATYRKTTANVDFDGSHKGVDAEPFGKERGTMAAWASAPHVAEAEYTIRHEVHNPMEMHATIATWHAPGKLKLYDKTQGVNSVQQTVSRLWEMPKENVEVISEFMGGGFGSGLKVWPNVPLAIMASSQLKRPVKLVLTRPQMFTLVGYRPQSWQKVRIGADKSGKFTGIWHQAKHATAIYDNFNEGIVRISRMLYDVKNIKTEFATVPLNLSAPTWMRGPGDCTGAFALESAVDELSYVLKMDPVQLRLQNLALRIDPDTGKPWSTNYMGECVTKGAEMIGWGDRKALPGTVKDGDWQIGYGMAVGMWFAGRQKASAAIRLDKDGVITVETAMTDIGTGTGTAMQNIAHEYLGIPKEKIKVKLGQSTLPPAPSQGGSTGLSSLSGAVTAACEAFKSKMDAYASTAGEQSSPANYSLIMQKNKLTEVLAEASSGPGEEQKKYAFCSGAAHFCKVKVHSKTGKVKVEKMASVVDAGHIVNQQAAANQVSGAAVGGIGMALSEEQLTDNRYGCLVGNDLAGYHFAVNADAPIIDVDFIHKTDVNINPTGSKGVGEVGIIGTAAAIANAIYNATGKRLRDLPITPDKVLLS